MPTNMKYVMWLVRYDLIFVSHDVLKNLSYGATYSVYVHVCTDTHERRSIVRTRHMYIIIYWKLLPSWSRWIFRTLLTKHEVEVIAVPKSVNYPDFISETRSCCHRDQLDVMQPSDEPWSCRSQLAPSSRSNHLEIGRTRSRHAFEIGHTRSCMYICLTTNFNVH